MNQEEDARKLLAQQEIGDTVVHLWIHGVEFKRGDAQQDWEFISKIDLKEEA